MPARTYQPLSACNRFLQRTFGSRQRVTHPRLPGRSAVCTRLDLDTPRALVLCPANCMRPSVVTEGSLSLGKVPGRGLNPEVGLWPLCSHWERRSGSVGSRSCSLPTTPPGLGLTLKIGLLLDQQTASPNSVGCSGMRGDLVGVCACPRSFPLLPHTHLLFLGFLFWLHLATRGPLLPLLLLLLLSHFSCVRLCATP